MSRVNAAASSTALLLVAGGAAEAAGMVCDVDVDGDIDKLDVGAIFAAMNASATEDDPRDSVPDGFITLLDAGVCRARCTLAGCEIVTPDDNTPPVADAGDDQSVTTGATVTLDGSGSSDADGDALTFEWSLTALPAGSAALLSDPSAVMPTFVADVAGFYVARLVVDDGAAASAPDEVVVVTTPGNTPPVADAGPDQTVLIGDVVQLDGSASSDVDGDVLRFAWTLVAVPAGSGATLSDAAAVNPTFVPDLPGDYVFRLVVNDGLEDGAPDEVVVTTANSPPVADAGPDQTVPLGALVELDGSGSSDADGDPLGYAWSLTSRPAGSAAALDDPGIVSPTLVADAPGTYVVQLIVDDGMAASLPDSVVITTGNTRPVADAGSDDTVTAGDIVALDGSGSFDADGDSLTFAWAFTLRPNGSAAALDDFSAVDPTFVADAEGLYVVQLIVSDAELASPPDTVTITAEAPPTLPEVTVVTTDDRGAELGGNTAAFRVSRSGDTADPLTVSYAMLGSATNGVDYGTLSGTITIPSGASGADVVVGPIADAEIEGTESVVLSLVPGAGYGIGAAGAAIAVITDSVVVSIVASDASASERTLDPASFTVSRAGDDLAEPLIVLLTRSGAANDPLHPDDTNRVDGLVTIPAGQASVAVTATPVRDNLVEGDEDLTLTVVPNTAYVIGTPASATIVIEDDPPVVVIAATKPDAAEAGPVPGELTFSRAGGNTAAPLTVRCAFTGTAGNSADYVFTSCDTVIPAGALSAARTITPRADNRVEQPETIIATLEAATTYLVGSPSSATITIADDPPLLAVVAADPDAAEAGLDPGVFALERSGGNLADVLIVVVSRGGSAASGVDFVPIATGIVGIPAGETSLVLSVVPIDDAVAEGPETVELTVSPADRYVITSGNATVTIADDDS